MKLFDKFNKNKSKEKQDTQPKYEVPADLMEAFVDFTIGESQAGNIAMGKREYIYFIAFTDDKVNNFVKELYTLTKSYKNRELDSEIYKDFIATLRKKYVKTD